MRRDAGEDATARIGAEAFEHGVGGLPVGRRLGVDQRMADDGADARLLDGWCDAIAQSGKPEGGDDSGEDVHGVVGAENEHGGDFEENDCESGVPFDWF